MLNNWMDSRASIAITNHGLIVTVRPLPVLAPRKGLRSAVGIFRTRLTRRIATLPRRIIRSHGKLLSTTRRQQTPAQGRPEVALSRDGGTVTVPVVINGPLRLGCIVDSGASNVVLPADVVMTLLKDRNAPQQRLS